MMEKGIRTRVVISHQIRKEVAHVVLALAGQSADKGDAGGVAAGGGDEHHVR